MTGFRFSLALAATGLLLTAGAAAAYEADEARAIVMARPEHLSPRAERIVLATQRHIEMEGPGELVSIDHTIWMVGPAGPRDRGRMRWTHRIGIEAVWLLEGWVHHPGGGRDPIPPDSARTEPCLAAGPEGYPGLADFTITPPSLSQGDIVEVKVKGKIAPVFAAKHYSGEHHFGGPDSTIESEFSVTFPNQLPLRTWWFGAVPEPKQVALGPATIAIWLLGHLPPEPPWERTVQACVTDSAPDTSGPPVLRYGFPDEWESIAQSRRRLWRIAFEAAPEPLVAVSRGVQNKYAEPAERLDAVVAWVDEHLRPLDIPAARMWFEPADISEVLARGGAIPRDRAAILVWLLRSVGVVADAVMVSSGQPLIEEVPLAQQLDTWLVLARPRPTIERWIDLRPRGGANTPLPAGKAFIWTTSQAGESIFASFPGIDAVAGR